MTAKVAEEFPGNDRHIYGLDLLRICAAGMVALLHLTYQYPPLTFIPPVGWVGVEIFFVLSGFVIAASLTNSSPRRFIKNRLLRLYPTAWGCTIIGSAAVLIFGGTHTVVGDLATLDPRSFIVSLALFGGRFFSSAYWTLEIELAFYAFCLLYFIVCPQRDVSRLAKILIIWATPYIILLTLSNLDVFEANWLDFGYGFRNASLLRHGPLFALGMLLWQLTKGDKPRSANLKWMGAAILLSCAEILCRSIEFVQNIVVGKSPVSVGAISLGLWGSACIAIIISIRCNTAFPRHIRLRSVTRTLGLMTYPFYLIHQSVSGSVMGYLIIDGMSDTTALAISLVASLVLSWAILVLWDPAIRNAITWIETRAS
ncbi:acyltransferase family protein [Methylobacterium goesingense]|uniref:Peptidoglycan/LPS O-acetylase OafA/YrhL n=1 Tax=Methylobacterium goesingense TaxID=243690 RepID=A0ABV2LBT0_9HYPH|nr:acyltransferase [Methylobacterium goesingense]